MSGQASRTGLIACVGIVLWLISAGSAHAAPSWLPAFDLGFGAERVTMSPDGTTVHAGRPFVGSFYRATVGDVLATPSTLGQNPGTGPAVAVDGAGDGLVLWGSPPGRAGLSARAPSRPLNGTASAPAAPGRRSVPVRT